MTLQEYFFGTRGRIGRQEYWIGMLGLIALSMAVSIFLDPGALAPHVGPTGDKGLQVMKKAVLKPPSFAHTVWSLFVIWPSTAIAIKRFNDRDWPWWPGYALGLAMAALVVANYFGLLLDPETMNAGEKAVLLGLVAAFFWSIVENGFQKGTDGDNRYGSDPLANGQT